VREEGKAGRGEQETQKKNKPKKNLFYLVNQQKGSGKGNFSGSKYIQGRETGDSLQRRRIERGRKDKKLPLKEVQEQKKERK